MIHHFFHHLVMATQEPGSLPGKGLKWYQTFLLYFVIPAGLFLLIAGIAALATRPKRK